LRGTDFLIFGPGESRLRWEADIPLLHRSRRFENQREAGYSGLPTERGPQMRLDKQSTLLCELEKKLQRPEIRSSPEEVAGLLADEFFEFGASGSVWTRKQVIKRLPLEQKTRPAHEVICNDVSVHWLAEGVALVTYRGTWRIPSEAKESHSLRSSIWKLTNGQWRIAFHQGTPTRHAN
jgi:hypothetical protein